MTLVAATHNGPFHADDVLAWALLNQFLDEPLTVVRTRDPERIDAADIVFDVGGRLDPDAGRFDHHQASYEGPRSSAGLVLDWLEASGHVPAGLAADLRERLVDYVDAVDNGRTAPRRQVPCFPTIVEAFNAGPETLEQFDDGFLEAGKLTLAYLRGLVTTWEQLQASRIAVLDAMQRAVEGRSRVIELDTYHKWKEIYFEHGGETHPTDYVLFPGNDDSWRLIAIPPRLGDFGQKRPLPASWAGLSGDALVAATGIPGSVFCHKNRFIAVFETLDTAREAIRLHGLG